VANGCAALVLTPLELGSQAGKRAYFVWLTAMRDVLVRSN